jgi:hypothetical protein
LWGVADVHILLLRVPLAALLLVHHLIDSMLNIHDVAGCWLVVLLLRLLLLWASVVIGIVVMGWAYASRRELVVMLLR